MVETTTSGWRAWELISPSRIGIAHRGFELRNSARVVRIAARLTAADSYRRYSVRLTKQAYMKRLLLGAMIVLLAAPPAFSQTKNASVVPEAASEIFAEAKRAIDKGNAEWIEAWEKGNPEMLAAIFTDDGVMLSQDGKVFKGRQQILERQKAAMQSVTRPIKVSVITVKIWLDGDAAYETGKYKYEYTEKGKPTTEEGRYVTMWKRQGDGSWKLAMDMAVPEK
jgi:uncharacterized protein (TIGR02246 family)